MRTRSTRRGLRRSWRSGDGWKKVFVRRWETQVRGAADVQGEPVRLSRHLAALRADESVPKRFDEQRLREWCSARSVDFETDRRVNHDRSDQPCKQYRCVFARADEEYVLSVEELTLTATRSSSARPSSTAPNDWTRGS